MPPSHDSYSDDDASSSSSASDASFREGASVEAQRREGGKWRAATVLHVSDSGATYDLDFGSSTAARRAWPRPACDAGPRRPPRRRRAGSESPRSRRRRASSRARGPRRRRRLRGDRDAEDALRKSLGWLATRARPADLEDAIADRGVDDVGASTTGAGSTTPPPGKDEHVRIILDAVRRAARDDDGGGDDERPAGPLDAKEALDGWTPLHLAVVGRHVAVVRLLLKAGARADAKDKHGDAPSHPAASMTIIVDDDGVAHDLKGIDVPQNGGVPPLCEDDLVDVPIREPPCYEDDGGPPPGSPAGIEDLDDWTPKLNGPTGRMARLFMEVATDFAREKSRDPETMREIRDFADEALGAARDAMEKASDEDAARDLFKAVAPGLKASVVDTLRDSAFTGDVRRAVVPALKETVADADVREAVGAMVKSTLSDVLGDAAFAEDMRATVGSMVKASVLDSLKDEAFMGEVRAEVGKAVKATVRASLQDDELMKDVRGEVGRTVKQTMGEALADEDLAAQARQSMKTTLEDADVRATLGNAVACVEINHWFGTRGGPLITALHEDVVPEVKKVALGTLRDEAFTSEVRQTLGPLVRATVMDTLEDEAYTTKVRNTTSPLVKKTVIDTLADDAFTSDVLERMAPMVSITLQDAVPTIKASVLETLNDDDFTRTRRQTVGPMLKSTFVDTIHDKRFTDEVRIEMGPMINNTLKDMVPTIKEAVVGTLADGDFTSDVRGLVGPMVSTTLRDEAMKETVTSTIKDYTLDMVHAEFTAELRDLRRRSSTRIRRSARRCSPARTRR
ncbi:hypothetical protein JL720_11106 [Aureococcus anophagefferens]|nr:hypothetical protein JL720_11106 [Aureococcus anophagefferens]